MYSEVGLPLNLPSDNVTPGKVFACHTHILHRALSDVLTNYGRFQRGVYDVPHYFEGAHSIVGLCGVQTKPMALGVWKVCPSSELRTGAEPWTIAAAVLNRMPAQPFRANSPPQGPRP